MKFTKMQGIGNDYVYVNCFQEQVPDPAELAIRVSDRHFGVGSDGLILICPSEAADFRMAMYNADGSEGAMCGNGIRCVGKYVYDYGLTDQTHITVETKSGIKTLELLVENGKVARVKVDMGAPILEPARIPVVAESDRFIDQTLDAKKSLLLNDALSGSDRFIDQTVDVAGRSWQMTCVSMGNPHAVVYLDDVESLDIEKTGPQFEHHPMFPDRVNTEFVRVLDGHTVQMRVWERGSGETMACGTGACAVAVASILNGYVSGEVTVKLLGGDLQILWDQEKNTVYMTGPAAVVFDGELPE